MSNIFDRIFNVDKRRLKEIEKKIEPVLALSQTYRNMSDEELKAKTEEFKEKLANGATLDDILVDAFATVREAAYRVIGEYPYKEQLMGAAVMQGGDIAEMKTGEGKTLTSVMAVYLNALTGKGVHVVTVNEYLAKRDSEWMGDIHRFLGLTVGLNLRQLTPLQKRNAYLCDITYTTNAEVGFDYLRDNMVIKVEDRVLRELNFALVDEVDSILIDESRTPLIISGGEKQTANQYLQADRFAKRLSKEDYDIDIKGRTIQLTESGVAKAEKAFKVENLYNLDHTNTLHHINQALKANYIMAKDIEYVVDKENDEIVIVDQNTGRMMKGRAYSDGLHQAIEAKEGISIKQETTTLATITYQNFFRLYNKLAGMTGTAKTEEEEFMSIYNMRVYEIPTHRPVIRIDLPDAVYGTKKAKYEALVNKIKELNEKGQPVLVGTIAVETSELISKMLKSRKIRHEILNAKNHQREAEIIAKAGRKGAVTIATNMAGRGTDIKLQEGVIELGGLAVLGSERHESRRIDNQLRGRSGRQGDPGFSQFYVSVQDDLMVRFGSERMEGLFASLGDVAIESKQITKAISSAQRRVEGVNFDGRKALLEYDDVLRQQREIIYEQRNFILENDDVHGIVKEMFDRVVRKTVENNTDYTTRIPTINSVELIDSLNKLGFKEKFDEATFDNKEVEEVVEVLSEKAWNEYEEKIKEVKKQVLPIEKAMVLKIIDRAWVNHIDTMSKLRDGIHLRSYAQDNPLQAYVNEGYEMFEGMMQDISMEIVRFCMNVRIVMEQRKR
ncbi:MAG: preprotein translocase subunit SecA [Erysipelotrichaceae bacterium]|jgi:preprotein translocase subunit SecA|nr:preprotein translocase subunit SecA [Erysipelotrichaceae bacterium]